MGSANIIHCIEILHWVRAKYGYSSYCDSSEQNSYGVDFSETMSLELRPEA